MEVDSKFASIFQDRTWLQVRSFFIKVCTASQGRSHHLIKKAHYKQLKANRLQEERANLEKELGVSELKEDIMHLRDILEEKNEQIEKLEEDRLILKELFDLNIIDEKGNLINH